jgi:hypothetical protein
MTNFLKRTLFLSVFTSNAMAINTYTGGGANDYLTISEISPFSHSDTIVGEWAGFTQLKFSAPIEWVGGTQCSTGGVAIRSEDTHIQAIVMQAIAMGKPVRLYADDSQKLVSNCILRAITIRP